MAGMMKQGDPEGNIEEDLKDFKDILDMILLNNAEKIVEPNDEVYQYYDSFQPYVINDLKIWSNTANNYTRQMACRMTMGKLRAVLHNPDAVHKLMMLINYLLIDKDSSLKGEVIDNIPLIANLCTEKIDELSYIIMHYLLPLLLKLSSDHERQVRKKSHSAILILMDHRIIAPDVVEEQVCPLIIEDQKLNSIPDCESDIIDLICKMAPLLGTERTEKLFLDLFVEKTMHHLYNLRVTCAANFGNICAVVGRDCVDSILVPKFIDLCNDEMWAVKKSCAETFVFVSCTCSLSVRKKCLVEPFVNLLKDESKWVRMSAFRSLGPFISTFADPGITRLTYNQHGELVIINLEGLEFRLTPDMDSGLLESRMYNSDFSDKVAVNTVVNMSNVVDFENTQVSNLVTQSTFHYEHSSDSLVSVHQNNEQVDNFEETVEDEKENLLIPDSIHEITDNSSSFNLNTEQCDNNADSTCQSSESEEDLAETIEVPNEAPCISNITRNNDCSINSSDKLSDNSVSVDFNVISSSDGTERLSVEDSLEEKKDVNKSEEPQQAEVSECYENINAVTEVNYEEYNTFQFWRPPIPELEPDILSAKDNDFDFTYFHGDSLYGGRNHVQDEEFYISKEMRTLIDTVKKFYQRKKESEVTVSTSDTNSNVPAVHGGHKSKVSASSNLQVLYNQETVSNVAPEYSTNTLFTSTQDIVPQILIDYFVSMPCFSNMEQPVPEFAHQCAFSLPAVALTLGRDNWPLIKSAYIALASNIQWKVRRIIASSLHEIASILGEELACGELVPIFSEFLKDLDEVRIGALRHLADFFKLITCIGRDFLLPKLSEFLRSDNESNWRYRKEFAEQLCMLVDLFSPIDCKRYLSPLAITLLLDKAAAVREKSLTLVTRLVDHFSADQNYLRGLLAELAEHFAHSTRWNRRQVFPLLCSRLVIERVLPLNTFGNDVLPHLLDLCWDPVPNVRLTVARTLARDVLPLNYFSEEQSPYQELLLQVLRRLQNDVDKDVKYFAMCSSEEAQALHENRRGK